MGSLKTRIDTALKAPKTGKYASRRAVYDSSDNKNDDENPADYFYYINVAFDRPLLGYFRGNGIDIIDNTE